MHRIRIASLLAAALILAACQGGAPSPQKAGSDGFGQVLNVPRGWMPPAGQVSAPVASRCCTQVSPQPRLLTT